MNQREKGNWSKKTVAIAAAAVLLLTAGIAAFAGLRKQGESGDLLDVRLSSLWDAVSGDDGLPAPEGDMTVFLSLSDRDSKARVFHASAPTLEEAWKAAESEARRLTKKGSLSPMWVKADVVTVRETVPLESLEEELQNAASQGCRMGLALDPGMETAFLETECNGNGLYDYESGTVSPEAIQAYSGTAAILPAEVTLFLTQGYFCGMDNITQKLSAEEKNFGVRRIVMGGETAQGMALAAASYLQSQVQEDGRFRYGRYANGKEIPGYNALRHWGAVWALLEAYRISPDDGLAQDIDRAINYALEDFVVYRDSDTAFVLDPSANEIKLGGGSLAVIALTAYEDIFDTDRHDPLLKALGNGILTMSDPETGTYQHIWTPDYQLKFNFRTIFYDGEATFALCRLYGRDPNNAYLNMARKAADRMIADEYEQYRDPWTAYAVNELTRYDASPRYFDFALKNAWQLSDGNTASLNGAELLNAAWETYTRAKELNVNLTLPEGFDEKRFSERIGEQMEGTLSSFGFPEAVMYFEHPMEFYGCCFVRQDGFRARIDDAQHFICAYAQYARAERPVS